MFFKSRTQIFNLTIIIRGNREYLSSAFEKHISKIQTLYGKSLEEVIEIYELETREELGIHDIQPDGLYEIYIKNAVLRVGNFQYSEIYDDSDARKYHIYLLSDVSDKVDRLILEKKLRQREMHQIIEGQEAERARIATDLHDSLGQILNTLKLAIRFQNESDIREMIDMAIQENRRISENLMPKRILDLDLDSSLQAFVEPLNEQIPDIQVSLKIIDKPDKLTESQKIHIYRIVQEATTNAIKHAYCNNITIQIMQNDEHILMSIEDDGRGFDNKDQHIREGNGLRNIEYRTRIVGGKMNIETAPGKGTFLYVEIPKNNKNENIAD
jgi:signal transduction histidine kinase